MGQIYITRLMMAKCCYGLEPMPLMIIKDHGVFYHNTQLPLLNANDHIPNVNILSYSACLGKGQPGTHTPCNPDTAGQAWQKVNERYIIDGAPALMEESTLACKAGGGIIRIDLSLSICMDPPTPEGAKRNGGQ